ncbi:NAD(+) diphosphatase [Leptolyngbya sp. FACHB-261]|uniref:NAD(+) diphosphatase n=1 Tax=Leptolyngbya sp. FACHB-261 TaxID=2692806 RepID=UPI001682275E|nr:NAD(+) diphosphatase [Leptolyngbya sp. FACHB-261]MBD2099792.1 NAD(+) diphosphatase [Leptolyngbya sp. FACHB-261]
MSRTFIPGIAPPEAQSGAAWWFAFVGNKLLVQGEETASQIPNLVSLTEIGLQPVRTQFLGSLEDQPCYAAELPQDASPPTGMALRGLRELYGTLAEDLYAVSGRAFQVMEWDRTHQYCGHCATPMTQLPTERVKRCPKCGLVNYPRLSPAIIVLISRGEELLLARAHRFPSGMYSVLAGFVEPGESLEETVVREVREEVGIEVKDIRYFGSQPWPFPNSLMIGFTATYAGGEIVVEAQELVEAAWFSKYNLPKVPPRVSIARKLIDWFVSTPD